MRSKVRWAAGIAIALLALALASSFTYSLASEYGGGVAGYAVGGLVAAPVVAFGAWLVFRHGLWAAAGGLALGIAATLTGGMLGEAEHDRARLATATACSADERAEFAALGAVPTNGEVGIGSADGSCGAGFGGRTRSSLDELRRAIEGRGWKSDGGEAYARDGKRLRLEVTDEGDKGLDIVARIL